VRYATIGIALRKVCGRVLMPNRQRQMAAQKLTLGYGRRSRLQVEGIDRAMPVFCRGGDDVLDHIDGCRSQGLCRRGNCSMHCHANEAMVFRRGLVLVRSLPQRRCFGMGVAGLRRTHKDDHQNAYRRDQPQPCCRLSSVVSALEMALHFYFALLPV